MGLVSTLDLFFLVLNEKKNDEEEVFVLVLVLVGKTTSGAKLFVALVI